MRSLALFAVLLAGTCMDRGLGVPAFGMMGAMPFGNPAFPMGFGGHAGLGGTSRFSEPELLNCFASFLTPDGRNVANELAVTIEPRAQLNDLSMQHGGMSPAMGYHQGMVDPYFSMQTNGQDFERLSARIELISNTAGGTGFVVFTSRARVDEGCLAENFGEVLLPDDDGIGGLGMSNGMNHGMGYGMGLGMGQPLGYGMGHPMGMGLGYGMGYNMGFGFGNGIGFGHGMGHNVGPMFGFNQEGDRGVITEINVTPGALTTAVVDDVGFTNLRDLAGRGVLVCSSISYDLDWRPTCEGEFFSCCNLKYDTKGVGLTNND